MIIKKIQTKLLSAGMFICLLTFLAAWLMSARWYLLSGVSITAAVCLLRSWLIKREHRITDKLAAGIFAGACLLLLAAQVFFVLTAGYSPAIGDPQVYGPVAEHYATTGSFTGLGGLFDIYPSRYPNTWGMIYLTAGWYFIWYHLTGSINVYAGQVLDIIAIQTAVVFTYLTARRVFRTRTDALICGISAALSPIYLIFTPIFHSDIISVVFTAPALYLLSRGYSCRSKKQLLWFGGAALLLGLGNTVKGTIIIIAIAAAIVTLLRYPLRRSVPAAALFAAFVMLASTGIMQLGLATGLSSKEKLDEYRYPVVHWIMMSASKYGGCYHAEDSAFTRDAGSYEQKKQADTEELKNRLDEMKDPRVFYVRAKHKVYRVWNSSGRSYAIYLRNCTPTNSVTRHFINSKATSLVCKAVHRFQMFAMIFAMLYACRRRSAPLIKVSAMSIAGLMIFLTMWEAAPRYTITYLPLMHILTVAGVRYLSAVPVLLAKKRKTRAAGSAHPRPPAAAN